MLDRSDTPITICLYPALDVFPTGVVRSLHYDVVDLLTNDRISLEGTPTSLVHSRSGGLLPRLASSYLLYILEIPLA